MKPKRRIVTVNPRRIVSQRSAPEPAADRTAAIEALIPAEGRESIMLAFLLSIRETQSAIHRAYRLVDALTQSAEELVNDDLCSDARARHVAFIDRVYLAASGVGDDDERRFVIAALYTQALRGVADPHLSDAQATENAVRALAEVFPKLAHAIETEALPEMARAVAAWVACERAGNVGRTHSKWPQTDALLSVFKLNRSPKTYEKDLREIAAVLAAHEKTPNAK